MPGQKSKPLDDILVSLEAEQERCALQQRRASELVKQAQRAVRDSKRLHRWHMDRNRKRRVHSR